MTREGAETKLIREMRTEAKRAYGDRIVAIKYHGNQFSEAGVSDLLICLDGHFIAVEVKHPKNYGKSIESAEAEGPTLKQRAFGQRVAKAGGAFAVCASTENFMAVLASIAPPTDS